MNLKNQLQMGRTARENGKYRLKTKYCVTGALRNGNGKWGHAT